MLGNVTAGVNGQFIDWEIDLDKIQILQKFSLQVSSWFQFSIEKQYVFPSCEKYKSGSDAVSA